MPNKSTKSRATSAAKVKLNSDVERLGVDHQALMQAAITEAHRRVMDILRKHFKGFNAKQQDRIRTLAGTPRAPSIAKAGEPEETPRYWLPFSGQTWSGRGRPPKAFVAWEGTAAHTEWKKRHPEERFPKFPG